MREDEGKKEEVHIGHGPRIRIGQVTIGMEWLVALVAIVAVAVVATVAVVVTQGGGAPPAVPSPIAPLAGATATPTPMSSPSPSATPTPTPTATPTPTPSPTSTPTPLPVWGLPVYYKGGTFKAGNAQGSDLSVPIGTSVELYLNLYATGYTNGELTVEIRRDFVGASDDTAAVFKREVVLGQGTNSVLAGSFKPTLLTSGSLRQYYFRVWWAGNLLYDPTEPSTREQLRTYVP